MNLFVCYRKQGTIAAAILFSNEIKHITVSHRLFKSFISPVVNELFLVSKSNVVDHTSAS